MQDRHFIECIANGARPLTDGENGLAVVEALEAAELSRRLGRPVLLEEVSSAVSPSPLVRRAWRPQRLPASDAVARCLRRLLRRRQFPELGGTMNRRPVH